MNNNFLQISFRGSQDGDFGANILNKFFFFFFFLKDLQLIYQFNSLFRFYEKKPHSWSKQTLKFFPPQIAKFYSSKPNLKKDILNQVRLF